MVSNRKHGLDIFFACQRTGALKKAPKFVFFKQGLDTFTLQNQYHNMIFVT